MPHHKSAEKRLKKSKVENAYNRHYRTMMKTAIKKVRASATKDDAAKNYIALQSILDKLVIKGIIKKNNASNKKSRISDFVSKIGVEPAKK
jgi:small subunit ribosomal protein S20